MLEYLGIPVIRAKGEAEGLCAELDRKDLVDFCVTPDSDAFVHGAKRVIKILQADPKVRHLVAEVREMCFKVRTPGTRSHLCCISNCLSNTVIVAISL
jgi:5'-3' exonuclease